MKVSRIKWLSKAAEEALVIVTDGTQEIGAYCQPCDYSVGEEVSRPLTTLAVKELHEIDPSTGIQCADKQSTGLGYEIVAKVVNSKSGLLSVGDIRIESD